MKRLWQRLQLDAPEESTAALYEEIHASVERACETLRSDGRLRPNSRPSVELPKLYEEVLQIGLRTHRKPDMLRTHFLRLMPELWITQIGSVADPDGDFFHRPLAWDRLPRLSAAINSFMALLQTHGTSPVSAWSWASIERLQDKVHTLADWMELLCFGQSFPLLYAYPGDLDAYRIEVRETGDFWAVFDKRFTNPLVHELSHFGRDRAALFPPLLDESLSAYFGALAHPDIAYPEEGSDNGLMGAAFFTQIGQAFVRNFGLKQSLEAHIGTRSFASVVGENGLSHVERLGWAQLMESEDVSLLAGHETPSFWQKIFYLLGAGESLDGLHLHDIAEMSFSEIPVEEPQSMDHDIVRDAIRSMCLHSRLEGASYRVESCLPDARIHIDFDACSVTRSRSLTDASHVDPVYLFPPEIAATWRSRGFRRAVLRLRDWGSLDEAVSTLVCSDATESSRLLELHADDMQG